ncbi:MAG: rod shape-determining protein MreD [Sedimentisphaerales bacterium]|nr:rod shape-determining protein MreD [Sedimentisphaerales bacterium]
MRWIRFAVLVGLATIAQAGFLSNYILKPDLHIILLVFFAVYSSTTDAIITSFTLGFAADLIGQSMGTQMICFGILGTSIAYLNRVIALRKVPYQIIAIFAVTLIAGFCANTLNSMKNVSTITYSSIMKTAIYSAIVGPFIFIPCIWWMRIKTPHHHRRF